MHGTAVLEPKYAHCQNAQYQKKILQKGVSEMGNSTDIYKTETRPNPDSDEALIAAIAEEDISDR